MNYAFETFEDDAEKNLSPQPENKNRRKRRTRIPYVFTLGDTEMDFFPPPSKLPPYHLPCACPITGCDGVLCESNIFAHLLTTHRPANMFDVVETYENDKQLMNFNPQLLELGKTFCIGIISYAGRRGEHEELPGKREFCAKNVTLNPGYTHYEYHLPLYIMASKTTVAVLTNDQRLKNVFVSNLHPSIAYYLIWVMSSITPQPVYVTITAFDKTYSTSRSVIRAVRSYQDSQCPFDFAAKDPNYLGLSNGDIKCLTGNKFGELVNIEFIVQESAPDPTNNLDEK